MDVGSQVREMRRRAGLSQVDLAGLAGVQQSVLSAYENGKRSMSASMFVRLAVASGSSVLVQLRPRHTLVGLPDKIADVVDGSRSGDRDAFRVVCEFVAAARRADRLDAAAMIWDEPAAVAPKWDALLGAIAEDVASQHHLAVPGWSSQPTRFVSPWWFVSPYKSQQAHALATSRGPYASRGVFVAPESLESV